MIPDVQIEKEIEAAIGAAFRGEMDKSAKTQNATLGYFFNATIATAIDPTRLPAIWIKASPYMPAGFSAAKTTFPAGACEVEIEARSNPKDDGDRSVLAALWACVRHVVYEQNFADSAHVKLGGAVITGTDSGMDDYGCKASVTVAVNVWLQ